MAGSFFIVVSEKFERGYECRGEQSKQAVDAANVPELVCIREMLAIPRHEEVAPMIRGKCQMQSIAC
jgi:hypothetical protein